MSLRWLPLVSTLVSASYLVGWLIGQIWRLVIKGRTWFFQRQMVGKVLTLELLSQSISRPEILLSLAGTLFGWAAIWWLSQWFLREWLTLIWIILAMLSEEFRSNKQEAALLAVMVLFDSLYAQSETGEDLFESLAKTLSELPAGEVKQAVHEVVQRRRTGVALEKCVEPFKRINLFLDEFVLILQLVDWRTGPALKLNSKRMLDRAGRAWDTTSRRMVLKERARPYVQFGHAVLIAGLSILLAGNFPELFFGWPSHSIVAWIGLLLLASGLLLHLILASRWLRRSMIVLILLILFIPTGVMVRLPNSGWFQVQTTTYGAFNLPDSMKLQGRTMPIQSTFPKQSFPVNGSIGTQVPPFNQNNPSPLSQRK